MATVTYNFVNIKPEFDGYLSKTFGDSNERDPSLAALTGGGFAVAYEWQSVSAPASTAVYNEFYDANGTRVVNSLQPLNGFVAGVTFTDTSIAQLTGGGLLTTWTQTGGGTHYAIVDPATGVITKNDTLLTSASSSRDFLSDVTALHNGGFAVVTRDNLSAGDQDADLRIYTAAGALVGTPALGFNSGSNEQDPAVAVLRNGNIVVAYEKEISNGSNTYGMAIEIYTEAGAVVLAPFNFDTTGTQNRVPDVVALHDGGFAVAYQDDQYPGGGGLSVAFFNSSGALRGIQRADVDNVADVDPSLTVLANGYLVVGYTYVFTADNDIYAAVFDPATMMPIQSFSVIENQAGNQTEAAVVGLANGTVVSAWTDANAAVADGNTDTSGTHLALQIDAYVRTTTSNATSEILRGDALRDVFIGGAGDDKFVYARNGNADTINDFVAGTGSGDRVNLSGFADVHNFTDVLARANQVGADTVITFNGDDVLTLLNVSKIGLTADDFSFLTFDSNVTLGLNSFGSSAAGGGWSSQNYYPREMADVNGDGRADIVGFGSAGTYVALGSGNGFAPVVLGINGFGAAAAAGGWSNNDAYHRTLADVNGDGRADIVGFGGDGTFVSLATTNGQFANPILGINSFGASAVGGGWSSDDLYHREVADVNGDGKADIVGFGSAGVYVSLATTNGQFAAPTLTLNSFGSSDAAGGWSSDNIFHREMADVNGDGKADIVGFGGAGVYVGLATSNGNFAAPTALALNSFGYSAAGGSWTSQDQFPRHLADINADGRADIVGFGGDSTFIAYGNANGTFTAPTADLASFSNNPSAGGWASDDLYPRMLADIDGGGAADIVGFGGSGVYVSHSNVDWLV